MVKTLLFHCRKFRFNPWLGITIPKAMRHSNNDNKKFLLILTVFNSDYMCIIGSNCFFLLHFLAHSSEGILLTCLFKDIVKYGEFKKKTMQTANINFIKVWLVKYFLKNIYSLKSLDWYAVNISKEGHLLWARDEN